MGELDADALATRLLSVTDDASRLLSLLVAAGRPAADASLALLGARGQLAAPFATLVRGGRYEALRALLADGGIGDSPGLRALAASRPTWDQSTANAAATALVRSGRIDGPYPFDLVIVPGFTPLDAATPIRLSDAGRARCDLARYQYETGRTGLLLLSGGAVHPPGTPWNEALEMRDYLSRSGVPDERLLVDPFARHSTTNLRNAGRLMLDLGIARACIVTGGERRYFAQDFYFAHPVLSTFEARCRAELGYLVGTLDPVADHFIAFTPSPDVRRPLWSDPLDY